MAANIIGGNLALGNESGSYDTAYNSALAANQQNYGNILAGYQQTAANQYNQQQAVSQGYTNLAQTIASQAGGLQQNAFNQLTATQPGIAQGYNNLAGQQSQGYNQLAQQQAQGYGALGQNVLGTLGGYNNTLGNQMNAQAGIQAGYGALGQNVQNTIQGITASQQQAINDAYAQQQGASQQSLINSGLGNTTVTQSVARGNLLDQQKASIALANQQAQLSAGYQSSLGLAGLNYANQANLQNTAQANLYTGSAAGAQQQIGMAGLGVQNQLGQANLGSQSQIGQAGLGYQQQALAEQVAQQNTLAGTLQSNYTQNLGAGGGLGYQGQAIQQQVGLAENQLGFMGGVSIPYPQRQPQAPGYPGAGAYGGGGVTNNGTYQSPNPGAGMGGYQGGYLSGAGGGGGPGTYQQVAGTNPGAYNPANGMPPTYNPQDNIFGALGGGGVIAGMGLGYGTGGASPGQPGGDAAGDMGLYGSEGGNYGAAEEEAAYSGG